MQPTCKHVPPRNGSFSTTTVFRPNSPARIAATYPPGPLPIIATSYFATRSLPSAGARTGERSVFSPQSHSIKARGGQADKTGQSLVLRTPLLNVRFMNAISKRSLLRAAFQTEKKPPALTVQTAASYQTSNFSSRLVASQPRLVWLPPEVGCTLPELVSCKPGESVQGISWFSTAQKTLSPVLSVYVRCALNFSCFPIYLCIWFFSAHHGPNLRLPLRASSQSCEGRYRGHGHEIRGALALHQCRVRLHGPR